MFDVTLCLHVSLALEDVFDKLVVLRRGGYCLEANGLCAAAISALGFSPVSLRHARVWLRAAVYTPREPPMARQQMVLVVPVDGTDYLVDVGFGGGSPAEPLALAPGSGVTPVNGELYRVAAGDAAAGEDSWLLWGVVGGEWRRFYSFEHVSADCPRAHAADFLLCSHFVQHARGTLFRTCRYATAPRRGGGRITLMGHELREKGAEAEGAPAEVRVTALRDAAQYAAAARQHFGLQLTDDEAAALFAADADE